MKTIQTKTTNPQARKAGPFFKKEGRKDFFPSGSGHTGTLLRKQATPGIQRDHLPVKEGYLETSVSLKWSDDDAEFYRRIVFATNMTMEFNGVPEACFWQPFFVPAHQFYSRHSNRHPLDLNNGDEITIRVSSYYKPSDNPCLRGVNIWHKEDQPPAKTPVQPAQATPKTKLNLLENGLVRWDENTPERVFIAGNNVTARMIAEDFYGDVSKSNRINAVWDEKERGGPFMDNSILPNTDNFFVIIEYGLLRPDLKSNYDRSVLIIDRDVWGAKPPITNDPNRDYTPYTGKLEDIYDSIAIHHAGHEGYKTMQEIQDLDLKKKDNADVTYHYGITLEGHVYEGRPINIRGAHIEKGNTGKIGIVLMANLDPKFYARNDNLTNKMEASLLRLIHYLKGKYPKIMFLGGHKEYNTSRSCPGSITMQKMDEWRTKTGLNKPVHVN